MNLELLEAFHQNYPEAVDGHLERIRKDDSKDGGCATFTVTIQFNRVGSLLAIGCNDGRIEIWDFVTRRVAKVLIAHTHPVCSISWSRNSRRLLSASTDNNVSIWNVITSDCQRTFRFPCPILRVQFNPRNDEQILVCPMRHAPVVINTVTGIPTIIHPEDENDLSIVASYDRRGGYIYTGNSKGKISIYDTKNFKMVNSFRSVLAANASVKSIEFSRRGDYFLLSGADRVIRVYNCMDALNKGDSDPEPIKKLKDLVTQSHWRKCCFSGDGEYICAGSMKQHSIYLWERASGTLVKILHGQKGETLLDVVWHPLRPIIISISNSVNKEQVLIWAQTQVQNWSAFAPDFKELDENVEYEERESEFDIEDEDKKVEESKTDKNEDVEVDVETLEPVAVLLSSDEEGECEDILMYLSISPELDAPDDFSGGEEQVSGEATGSTARKRTDSSPSSRSVEPPVKQGRSSKEPSSQTAVPTGQCIVVDLPNAPTDDVHPILSSRRPSKSTIGSSSSGADGKAEPGAAAGSLSGSMRANGALRKAGGTGRQRDRAKARR